jgi:5-methylcytosine-specific restriction endonuclease McrA
MKKCCRCKEEKDISFFGKNAHHNDNIHHYCKICQNEIAKEYRENNHNKVLNSVKKYRENENNKYKLFASSTFNDHKRYKQFIVNITKYEIEQLALNTNKCIYCDIELNYNRGKKYKTMLNSPSLDRTNNEKEININNIQIICHRCNTIKHDMTHKEFVIYCKTIVDKFYGGI